MCFPRSVWEKKVINYTDERGIWATRSANYAKRLTAAGFLFYPESPRGQGDTLRVVTAASPRNWAVVEAAATTTSPAQGQAHLGKERSREGERASSLDWQLQAL